MNNIYEETEYTKKLDMKLWKKLFAFAIPHKKKLVTILILMLAMAFIDAIFPLISKYAIDNFVTPGTLDGFVGFCVVIMLIITFQCACVKFMILLAGHVEANVPYEIRKAGFKKLQELSLSFYDKKPVGWLMARMSSDVKKLGHVLSWNIVDIVWSVSMMFFMVVLMFILDYRLALLVLSVVPLLIGISIYFRKKILAGFRKVRKANSKLTASYNEGIMGAKTIKTLVREKENLEEFRTITTDYKTNAVKTATISAIYAPSVIFLASIATGLALWRGGAGVISQAVTYGTMIAFISYSTQFFGPVHQLAIIFAGLQNAQASAERVLSLIETEPAVRDSSEVIKKFGISGNNPELPELRGDIHFKDVFFSYDDGEKVLEDFNLEIKAGETIALVGETGSGKTTIVNLVCRFYEPTRGQILFDGTDYREYPLHWLHSKLGYVLQEPHLFAGTVRENIAYGNRSAGDEEIINAAKLVNAHDFIVKLENGYDTEVGERGSLLSTGQKQLISFARAILADPCLFILDEATSSVDTETEYLIQKAIEQLLNGRTSFIIAHRLSTIRSADRILVIDNGRIIEQGSHNELIAKKGHYYNLYTNQFILRQST
jgi:ATP-binding cassette, subfamily B, bacterial